MQFLISLPQKQMLYSQMEAKLGQYRIFSASSALHSFGVLQLLWAFQSSLQQFQYRKCKPD